MNTKVALTIPPLVVGLLFWLTQGANAGPLGLGIRSSPCDALQPTQTVSEDKKASLDVMFRSVAHGGSAAGSTASSVESIVLEDEALAQAYFTYQACLLRDAGMIDQATAQELVRKLMGLDPAASPTVEGPPAPEPVVTTQPPAPPTQTTTALSGQGRLRITASKANGAVVLVDGLPVGKIRAGVLDVPVAVGRHSVTFTGIFLRRASRSAPPQTVEVTENATAQLSVSNIAVTKWWLWTTIGVLAVSLFYYFY